MKHSSKMRREANLYFPPDTVMHFKEGEEFHHGLFTGKCASILCNYREGTLSINYLVKDKNGREVMRRWRVSVGLPFTIDKEIE